MRCHTNILMFQNNSIILLIIVVLLLQVVLIFCFHSILTCLYNIKNGYFPKFSEKYQELLQQINMFFMSLIEKCTANKLTCTYVFVDFRKSFDSAVHEA